jgi:hypothetical protein
VVRPRITAAIAEARAHGDLKENAEYHAAREQQSFAEGRIQEIEGKLSNAQIIDISKMPQTGKVIFGVTVDIENVGNGESPRPTRLSVMTRRTEDWQDLGEFADRPWPDRQGRRRCGGDPDPGRARWSTRLRKCVTSNINKKAGTSCRLFYCRSAALSP